MDSAEMEMFLKYPFTHKQPSDTGWKYTGFIFVQGVDYDVTIESKDMQTVSCQILPTLKKVEINKENTLTFGDNCSPIAALEKVEAFIIKNNPRKHFSNHIHLYQKVLNEYSELRVFHIGLLSSKISQDFREIELAMKDEKGREHKVVVGVDFDNNSDKIFYIKEFELPQFHEKLNFQNDCSLISLYDKFVAEIENPRMQAFLNFMEEIDQVCWVLDPVVPSKRDTYRRIALGENISLVLTYNCLDVKNMPNIKFLGPRNLTAVFEDRLNNNFLNWDTTTEDPINELLILLGILEFPSKPAEIENTEFLLVNIGECCICFSSRLNDKLPEITCPNPSCNQIYHVECLYQWLSSLNPRRFYYEICEKCPNCEKMIHCPIPTTIESSN